MNIITLFWNVFEIKQKFYSLFQNFCCILILKIITKHNFVCYQIFHLVKFVMIIIIIKYLRITENYLWVANSWSYNSGFSRLHIIWIFPALMDSRITYKRKTSKYLINYELWQLNVNIDFNRLVRFTGINVIRLNL